VTIESGDLVEPTPPGCLVYEFRNSSRSKGTWMITGGVGVVISKPVGGTGDWVSRVEVMLPTGGTGWCYASSLTVISRQRSAPVT